MFVPLGEPVVLGARLLRSAGDIAAFLRRVRAGRRIVPVPPDTDTHAQSGPLQYAAAHRTPEATK